LSGQIRELRDIDFAEWSALIRAVLGYDVAQRFGGDMKSAASVWTAKSLVVTAAGDHLVGAPPAFEFARLIGADTLSLPSIGGHTAIFGDSTEKAVVRRWLTPR
jgi:homoserine acetyltransferase